LIIEKAIIGGQIVNAQKVENYPGFPEGISGFDLAMHMQEQAVKYSVEIVSDEVLEVGASRAHLVRTSSASFQTETIIIAAGAQYSKLGIPGEDEYLGKGISYCATCDGFMFRDKVVAVIGGGDTAVSDALELAQHCTKVYLIHRRDNLRASQVMQERALSNPKIQLVWNTIAKGIKGEQFITGIDLLNVKDNESTHLDVSGVFVAVGNKPNSEIFKNIVKLDQNGLIETDLSMRTSVESIFAAGDIRSLSARQVSTAVGDGAMAAMSAFKLIRN
jgi:thioredoxin reductase (NADPH)